MLGFGIATLASLLGFIIVQEAGSFVSALSDTGAAAALLSGLAFAAGRATGWAGGAGATDRFPVWMVFVVRNVRIVRAIAVAVVSRGEFVVCATASFLAQVPILLAVVVVSDAVGLLTEATPQELTTHELPRGTIRESEHRP